MTENELIDLIKNILKLRCETSKIELKKAKYGCPESLYDTLSSFSNTSGGVIVFGIDEKNNYKIEGIDNPQELQKKVTEQCLSMEPVVRPLFTVIQFDEKTICSAEIPEIDSFSKPCYYKGKGKNKGSYIRVGDADLPMTDYEIHSYEAFRYKTEDELRTKERVDFSFLNSNLIDSYISKLIEKKSNLINIEKKQILQLEGIIDKNNLPTICGILNFGTLPQMFSPNLDIVAVRCATNNYGEENLDGIRFIDNKRIDGTISSMLQQALSFIQNNTRKSTFINPNTGLREDKTEYPIKALREIILNALIHRDYSIYTENDPIRIEIYDDRIEISNPGGLYGRLTMDELGSVRSDIRNPYMASILETLDITENRYSGIPTIYNEMKKANLLAPKFEDNRGVFKVTLYNSKANEKINDEITTKIIEKCKQPRSKDYLAKEFGFDEKHPAYFINTFIKPLIEKGVLKYTIPNKPKSKNQRIVSVD
jgi:ATP-dependent DNA helicase RecG